MRNVGRSYSTAARIPPGRAGGGGVENWIWSNLDEDGYNLEKMELKIFELAIGTLKIESGACDLPPEGSKKSSLIDLSKF